jgi:hypothetical protein
MESQMFYRKWDDTSSTLLSKAIGSNSDLRKMIIKGNGIFNVQGRWLCFVSFVGVHGFSVSCVLEKSTGGSPVS